MRGDDWRARVNISNKCSNAPIVFFGGGGVRGGGKGDARSTGKRGKRRRRGTRVNQLPENEMGGEKLG